MGRRIVTIAVVVPAVVLLGACDSSLQPLDKNNLLVELDGGTPDVIQVYDDSDDTRQLPYQCEADTECEDHDPCTRAACTRKRCAYTVRPVQFTPIYIDTGDPAVDVSIYGDYLLVAMGEGGVELYDISDPTDPDQRGTAPTEGAALAVEAAAGGMIVSEGEIGIEGINIPALEQQAFRAPDSGVVRGLDEIYSVDLGARYGFISGFSDGFLILDFADLFSPQLVTGFNTTGRVHRVTSDYDIAVVADALGGAVIYAFDLEDGIDRVSTVLTEGRVVDADLKGDSLLIAEYGEGFSLVDVADMNAPRRLFDLPTATPAVAARLMGPQTAIMGEENGRLTAYDISLNVRNEKKDDEGVFYPIATPTAPTVLDTINLQGDLLGIDVERDLIAVALGEAGAALLTTGCAEPEE